MVTRPLPRCPHCDRAILEDDAIGVTHRGERVHARCYHEIYEREELA